MKLKGLSLFANVGIAETYLSEIGIDIIIANEIDDKRARFYSEMYPETKMIVGDVREKKITNKIIKQSSKIDIIIATPPCQGMSTVGKMENSDPRNYLITDTINLIKKIKPKYVLLENVPEQLKTKIKIENDTYLIPDYIKKELGTNYTFNSKVFNTKNYSVPQSRERSIFLLSRNDQKYIWESPKEDAKEITMKQAIGNLPSLDPLISDLSYEEHLKIFPEYEKKLKEGLKTSPYHKPVTHVYRQVYSLIHTPSGKSAFENIDKYKPIKKNGDFVKGFKNTYKRMDWDKPCNTITTYNRTIGSQENVHPGRLIKNKYGEHAYTDPRVLTLYEIIILSSLPEKWTYPTWASENFVRTVIGEGIPPLLVKKICNELIKNI